MVLARIFRILLSSEYMESGALDFFSLSLAYSCAVMVDRSVRSW
jgi:hypothetical protein